MPLVHCGICLAAVVTRGCTYAHCIHCCGCCCCCFSCHLLPLYCCHQRALPVPLLLMGCSRGAMHSRRVWLWEMCCWLQQQEHRFVRGCCGSALGRVARCSGTLQFVLSSSYYIEYRKQHFWIVACLATQQVYTHKGAFFCDSGVL